ncbi:shikimate dehydrogenase [Lampropedia aestuarii]|uniref:Shikimate dehydrogenase (NADP(+)) n=1 Tax=Lampropedia aestuarii TaxID=2562762 RepID=A0A4S5BNQ3_9BURK|nr:shikimate dehydrogenase [Lampropedia aestuarii]MDH5856357.1 shikimate dehydrogenase [Lampropedia aestuarii]THJ34307.1 shikimate dehydrogenase [Lampropedia aestuarii]
MSAPLDHTSPSTDQYVVIGNPIAHSRSPSIHQQFAALTSQSMAYERCLSPLEAFEATLHQLRLQGIRGANVTVPFKLQAAELAHWRDPRVTLAQAANTLVFEPNGQIRAYNTDGLGLVRDIAINAKTHITGQHLLLLGAGGAAAGALAPLIEQQPASIAIANRTQAKAQELVQRHQALAQQWGVPMQALALESVDSHALPRIDIVINATASSLQQASLPIKRLDQLLNPEALVYDMMYGPAAAPFLSWAQQQCPQVHLRDGLGMLVEQAAEAFAIWRGVRPPSADVLQALRQEISASH